MVQILCLVFIQLVVVVPMVLLAQELHLMVVQVAPAKVVVAVVLVDQMVPEAQVVQVVQVVVVVAVTVVVVPASTVLQYQVVTVAQVF
jgi:hypothetical protein